MHTNVCKKESPALLGNPAKSIVSTFFSAGKLKVDSSWTWSRVRLSSIVVNVVEEMEASVLTFFNTNEPIIRCNLQP